MKNNYYNHNIAIVLPCLKLSEIVVLFLAMVTISCSEVPHGQPPTDKVAPQPVSNINVESMPGGAKITYDLPQETDISYVKGEFLFQGKTKIIRSSVYNNFLVVEGLGDIEPVNLTLYVIDHSENASSPVQINFTPGKPPIESIYSSLKGVEDFGGVNLSWENELGIEIGITVFVKNDKGLFEEGETHYTNQRIGSYAFRGFEAQKREFGFSITDKWGNVSDTLRGEFTPLFEKLLDKSKHKRLVLPRDDATNYSAGWVFEKMFNDIIGDEGWHTRAGESTLPMPLYFTIDLGTEAKLSRFKLWHRQGVYIYGHFNPKSFEVWGTTQYKEGQTLDYWSGPWEDDWELLGDYEITNPSGEPTPTAEDIQAAANGFEFLVPIEKNKVQYIRFKVKSNFSGSNWVHISELSFYGQDEIEQGTEP